MELSDGNTAIYSIYTGLAYLCYVVTFDIQGILETPLTSLYPNTSHHHPRDPDFGPRMARQVNELDKET